MCNGKVVTVMGCGMIDPNVLKAMGCDPEVYTGFAAVCVERINGATNSNFDDIALLAI